MSLQRAYTYQLARNGSDDEIESLSIYCVSLDPNDRILVVYFTATADATVDGVSLQLEDGADIPATSCIASDASCAIVQPGLICYEARFSWGEHLNSSAAFAVKSPTWQSSQFRFQSVGQRL